MLEILARLDTPKEFAALGLDIAAAAWVGMILSALVHPAEQNPVRIAIILFFGGFVLSLFNPLALGLWVLAVFVAGGRDGQE